jgi:Subtilase family
MDGTSMATPHVAGVAAILFGAEPEASVDQVEEAILTTCKPLVKDEKERYGFGFVQPEAALAKLRKLMM